MSKKRPPDVQKENEAPAAPVRPRRWLVAQASALLEAVAATNYACYGSAGVPRYGGVPSRQPKDASTLCAELIVRGPQGENRLAWIDLAAERRTNLSESRATEENDVGGTDIASTVAQLQQTMTVLQASQASFTKLAGLSLFNMLN